MEFIKTLYSEYYFSINYLATMRFLNGGLVFATILKPQNGHLAFSSNSKRFLHFIQT